MPSENDTIAALATPPGRSAIAVVRASGPDCARLAQEIFGETPPPRALRRGDYRTRAGELLDDVLFTFFAGPKSYTGEDSLEISCHGNPLIAQKILEDLLARGGRGAEPGEFTQRAFLNGRMELSQAEAVMDLIHARSERALAAANAQLRGALGRRMRELIDRLVAVLARVEAHIDFPEEDLPAEDREWLSREVRRLSEETGRLLATNRYGALLREGIKTVIVGAPNAGKSSLLNRLVGRDRALVSPEPGTTRDFIEEMVTCGPHSLRLIDTAGLNPAPASIERLGIEQTWDRLAEADLILLVIDGSQAVPPLPQPMAARLTAANAIVVVNKSDLLGGKEVEHHDTAKLASVHVSALTGAGIGELLEAITSLADAIHPTFEEDSVVVNARHADALTIAREALETALVKISQAIEIELLASDLRLVLDCFGRIAGKVDSERILDELFATFCIGK